LATQSLMDPHLDVVPRAAGRLERSFGAHHERGYQIVMFIRPSFVAR
jgi:hypothetical protein